MAMYWTCQYGANHDCGEKCDCGEEAKKTQDFFRKHLETEPRAGQLKFMFDGKDDSYENKMCI